MSLTQAYDACFRCNPCSTSIHPRSSMWKEKLFIPMEPCKSLLLCSPLHAGSKQFGPAGFLLVQHCSWHCLPFKGGRERTFLHAALCVCVLGFRQRCCPHGRSVLQRILLSLVWNDPVFSSPQSSAVESWGKLRNQRMISIGRKGLCKISSCLSVLGPFLCPCLGLAAHSLSSQPPHLGWHSCKVVAGLCVQAHSLDRLWVFASGLRRTD